MRRVLCLGLDGADHDLVRDLLAAGAASRRSGARRQGRLRTRCARRSRRSRPPRGRPSDRPQPGRARDLQLLDQPEPQPAARRERGEPRRDRLSGAGSEPQVRSAFVAIPFTYPAEPIDGIVVTGYGGPERPEILPLGRSERIFRAYPDLVTAHHPMAERWWEDFAAYTTRLIEHVEQTASVCRMSLELEPATSVLCVDFMSSDHAGHLGYHRLDSAHPAHNPAEAGDELVRVYEAVDRACGELIDEAARRGKRSRQRSFLSDHGMKPIYWTFHANRWLEEAGHLRFRRRSLQPLKGGRLNGSRRSTSASPARRGGTGASAIRFPSLARQPTEHSPTSTSVARAHTASRPAARSSWERRAARGGPALRRAARGRALVDPTLRPPASRRSTSGARRSSTTARISTRRRSSCSSRTTSAFTSTRRAGRGPAPFDRHDRLDPSVFYGYSGHHGLTGILAAAGPGIRPGDVPEGSEITQLPATLLHLLGIGADGLDGSPIEPILDRSTASPSTGTRPAWPAERSVYSEEEEARLVERLRDLGYE